MTRAAGLACCLWLCLLACATAPVPRERTADAETSLEARFEGLGRDFFVRQRITARFGEEERRFEAALQSRCGELRLVGLSPFGMRLFTASRHGDTVEVETLANQPLPFSPGHVLRDVERTFFRSSPAPAGSVTRTVSWRSERVLETWHDGVLQSREIHPAEPPNAPPTVIRYGGPLLEAGISARIDLSNPHFGYVLEIENFEAEELTCPQVDGSGPPDIEPL